LDHHRLRAPDPDFVSKTGRIDSVQFISLIAVIRLALGSLERVQSAPVEVKQDGDS
jgi:hypothetical protein